MARFAIYVVALAFCSGFAGNSFAFKLDTHIWVGSEVVEDIKDDGLVTIEPFGEFEVDAEVYEALINHPKAYLYGNVGPDFFPDVIMGQTIIHPGASHNHLGERNESEWNSDEWMKHIRFSKQNMAPEELSFALGAFAHSATDFWAHTYVNTYSGNIFNLFDDDAVEAEIRHYLLEGYINAHTPDSFNSGRNVGKGVGVLNSYGGAFPNEFIADTLITHPDIQDKLDGAPHLKIAASIQANLPRWVSFVDSLRDPLYKMVGDIYEEYQDEFVDFHEKKREFHANFCRSPEVMQKDAYDQFVTEERVQRIDDIQNQSEEYIQSIYNNFLDEMTAAENKIHQYSQEYISEGVSALESSYESFAAVESDFLSKKQALDQKILQLDSKSRASACEITTEVVEFAQGIHSFLIDELPFGDIVSRNIKAAIDPLDSFDFDSPIDPLGLFGGSDTKPRPPKMHFVSGNRNYFEAQMANLVRALNYWLPYMGTSVEYDNIVLGLSDRIDLYQEVIPSLSGDETITLAFLEDSFTGFSNDSRGVFCDYINGEVDGVLISLMQNVQRLEVDQLRARGNLNDAVVDLQEALILAANEIHTVRHQFRKTMQVYTDELLTLASEVTSVENSLDSAQRLKDKTVEIIDDVCSEASKLEVFVDEGLVEGAPFVGSYLLDYYARMAGYDAEDGALYYEWIYFFLRTWELGIEQAINAYPIAQREVVDAITTPGSTFDDVKEPLADYLICEAPKIISMSPHLSDILCVIGASVETLSETYVSVQNEHDRFVQKYLAGSIPALMIEVKREINESIEEAVIQYTREKILGDEVFELLMHVIEGEDDDPYVLDQVFAESKNNYMVFDSITDRFSERVKSDMSVVSGRFNPLKFAPAHNALVFSKLTLLSAAELNRLVEVAGGYSGDRLFDETNNEFNILFGAVRTLDGNHQWLSFTPSYIRMNGNHARVVENLSYKGGFKLFNDTRVRSSVFNKIFIGPANQSIEDRTVGSFKKVVPNSYKYKPCKSIPFPNGEGDESCLVSWLIPVLHGLL